MLDPFTFVALGVFCAAISLSIAAVRWAIRGSRALAMLAMVASTLFVFVFPQRLLRGYDIGTFLVVTPLAVTCWAFLELLTSALSKRRVAGEKNAEESEAKPQMSLRSMVFAVTAIGIMLGLMSLAKSINGPRDIVGRFVSSDAPGAGISNVVIWMHPLGGTNQKQTTVGDPKEVVVEYDGSASHPEYVFVRPGDTLKIQNRSPHGFCPKGDLIRTPSFNVALASGDEFQFIPTAAEPTPCMLSGTIKPDWRSFLFITNAPIAISNSKGEWRLPSVPRGQHQLRIWHKDVGYIRKSIVVGGPLKYDASSPRTAVYLLDVELATRDIGDCRLQSEGGVPLSIPRATAPTTVSP